jgi:addiction module RelE/StbE family toxin
VIEIFADEGFKRSFKKIVKNNSDIKYKFKEKLELFKENPYNPILRTHKLGGKLQDYMAFSVDYNIRVLFKFIDKSTVLLIEIGSHDVIY